MVEVDYHNTWIAIGLLVHLVIAPFVFLYMWNDYDDGVKGDYSGRQICVYWLIYISYMVGAYMVTGWLASPGTEMPVHKQLVIFGIASMTVWIPFLPLSAQTLHHLKGRCYHA